MDTDHREVCTVITAIMGRDAFVLRDNGNWDGDRYVGFMAQVVDVRRDATMMVPGPTMLEAACELLAWARKEYPDLATKACAMPKCERGMGVYVAYVEAKTDAALAASAAILADMRSFSPSIETHAVAAE